MHCQYSQTKFHKTNFSSSKNSLLSTSKWNFFAPTSQACPTNYLWRKTCHTTALASVHKKCYIAKQWQYKAIVDIRLRIRCANQKYIATMPEKERATAIKTRVVFAYPFHFGKSGFLAYFFTPNSDFILIFVQVHIGPYILFSNCKWHRRCRRTDEH